MPNTTQTSAQDIDRTQISQAISSENTNDGFQSNKYKSELGAAFSFLLVGRNYISFCLSDGPRLITPHKIDVIRHHESEILILMTYNTCPADEQKPLNKTTSRITLKSIRNTISNVFKTKAGGVTIEDETEPRSKSEINVPPRKGFRINNSSRSMTKTVEEDEVRAPLYSVPSLNDKNISQASQGLNTTTDNLTVKKVDNQFDLRVPTLLTGKTSKNVVIRFFDQNEEYEVEPLGKDIGVTIVSLT